MATVKEPIAIWSLPANVAGEPSKHAAEDQVSHRSVRDASHLVHLEPKQYH